jgi:hypothetical protein
MRSERDVRGRFVKGHPGCSRWSSRDPLRQLFENDMFVVWRRSGRAALHQLCQEAPAKYFQLMVAVTRPPAHRDHRAIIEILSDKTLSDAAKITGALTLLQSVAPGRAVRPRYQPRHKR